MAQEGKDSIIDGQQRITSITLFLIYLNNLQKDLATKVSISNLIFSEQYGEKSFNMTDEDRQNVLKGLYDNGEFDSTNSEDETEININERYQDIDSVFPEAIDEKALPYFIDWFIGNVVIVKITAYSDENAYTIFETMNDRGMNLTSTEMLKGYVLSRISNKEERSEINELWKEIMVQLHSYESNADLTFFQAWFRGKYAKSMRATKANAENEDYELVGTQFHSWFKDFTRTTPSGTKIFCCFHYFLLDETLFSCFLFLGFFFLLSLSLRFSTTATPNIATTNLSIASKNLSIFILRCLIYIPNTSSSSSGSEYLITFGLKPISFNKYLIKVFTHQAIP